ncbi:MAG: DUF3999 family protein [Nitrospiraceae bacterium]|nr:DUF3999 family protein [Nitrospiraceae bacterium]
MRVTGALASMAAAVLLLPGIVLAESMLPENFRYSAAIQGQTRGGVLYQVRLGSDILGRCGPGCRDMRLFAADGREVPFVVIDHVIPRATRTAYELKATGYSDDAGRAEVVFTMPDRFEPVGSIALKIPDRDFRKTISIFGSHDGVRWEPLAEDAIFDFSSQVDVRKTEIPFAASSCRYFRLVIRDADQTALPIETVRLRYNGIDFSINTMKNRRLRIDGAVAYTPATEEGRVVYEETPLSPYQEKTDKDSNSVVTFRTGLPFDRVHIDAEGSYYYRPVRIMQSVSGKEGSFVPLAASAIYKFPLLKSVEEKSGVDTTRARGGYYRIVIENAGNQPLRIRGIHLSWVRKNLFFVPERDTPSHRLCAGSEGQGMDAPPYDLDRFVTAQNWNQQAFETLAASSVQENTAYRPAASHDRRAGMEKSVLIAVVLLLVIGLGYWLFALLRAAHRGR